MCPNIGYVLVHDGHPKRCSLDFECISSSGEFSCVKNYCCPKDPSQGKFKQQHVFLYGAHACQNSISFKCYKCSPCMNKYIQSGQLSFEIATCFPFLVRIHFTRISEISSITFGSDLIMKFTSYDKNLVISFHQDCNSWKTVLSFDPSVWQMKIFWVFHCPLTHNASNSFEPYLVAVCPNNGGLLLDEAQQPKLCMENIECQGSGKGAYFCNNGYCCPESGKCVNQLILIAIFLLQ